MDPSLLHNLTSKRQMRRLEKLWDDQDAFADAAAGRSKVVKDLLEEFHIVQHVANGRHEANADALIEHSLFKSGYGVWMLYVGAAAGDEALVNQIVSANSELIKGDGEFGLSDLLYAAARGKNVQVFQQILTLAKRVKAGQINCKPELEKAISANDDLKDNSWSIAEVDYVGLSYTNRTIQSKALLAAARAGNVEMVKELLKDNSAHATVLSFRDSNGATALHAAACRDHVQVVRLILELCHSSIHGQDGKGNTALHTAARRGCLKVATELMRFDKEPMYVRNKNGETPLHLAVMGTKQPLPKLILKQGGQIEVVKQIMAYNNDSVMDYVNWKNNEGHTALHLSVMSPRIDDILVALLLQSPGIHVLETDNKGFTALDLAQSCRESFPAAEFRCNIAIALLNAAISSNSNLNASTAGRPSTGPGSAAISVDLADPLMCSFSHDIAIPSDAESRFSERHNFERRSLSADWTTDFQTDMRASRGPLRGSDTHAIDTQQVETAAMPDEKTLSRNLATLRQTSIGIFETRNTTIGSPSPLPCLSGLQSLFSSSTFRRAMLAEDSEFGDTLKRKGWNKFQSYTSVRNDNPQSLRQQFSSTANVLFHPNTLMESLELRQEVAAPSISVSPLASPTRSTDHSPPFSSPSYIKSWLKGAIVQDPSSNSTPGSSKQRMKRRFKQIASLTHLSFSSASETYSIHEQETNDLYLNPRRRFLAHDGSNGDAANASEMVIPLMQERLSRQSSTQSYMEGYHPCFCLDNWCQDGQSSTKGQGQTHARTMSAQNAGCSEGATSLTANVRGLSMRSQSSRSYKPIEPHAFPDHNISSAKRDHLQGPNVTSRRSVGSSPSISSRPSVSLSLSPWLSPSLRAARGQKTVVSESVAMENRDSDETKVCSNAKDLQASPQSVDACIEGSTQGSQGNPPVIVSSTGAALQRSKPSARQESFCFCPCRPCFQDGDVYSNGECETTFKGQKARLKVYQP